MNSIVINGVRISGGRNITVIDGRVIVDGKDVTPESNKEINISVEGKVDLIKVDHCQKVYVAGDVGSITTQSGAVEVGGNVQGSVQTMSGSVECYGSINSSVSTMSGSVKYRK